MQGHQLLRSSGESMFFQVSKDMDVASFPTTNMAMEGTYKSSAELERARVGCLLYPCVQSRKNSNMY